MDVIGLAYIGITGFTKESEVRRMSEVSLGRQLMVGVMTSYKTLNKIPSRWAGIYPEATSLKDIFKDIPNVMNTLHYADYECVDFNSSVTKAISFCGPRLHAIQLDMIFPPEAAVENLKSQNLKVILQVNRSSLSLIDFDSRKLVERLKNYSLDYVLLDLSGGQGKTLDAKVLRPYLSELRESRPDLGLAVAGGLGPATVHLLSDLAREFPGLSIDAESRLRSTGNAADPVDWNLAESYLIEAAKVLV